MARIKSVRIRADRTDVKPNEPVTIKVEVLLTDYPTPQEVQYTYVAGDVYVNNGIVKRNIVIGSLNPNSKVVGGKFEISFSDEGDYEVEVDAYFRSAI